MNKLFVLMLVSLALVGCKESDNQQAARLNAQYKIIHEQNRHAEKVQAQQFRYQSQRARESEAHEQAQKTKLFALLEWLLPILGSMIAGYFGFRHWNEKTVHIARIQEEGQTKREAILFLNNNLALLDAQERKMLFSASLQLENNS